MTEIYWITRLDALSGLFVFLAVFAGIGTLVAIICYIVGLNEDKAYSDYSVERMVGKIFSKIFIPMFVICVLGAVFIPTTKEALVIYAVGGGLDYIKSDTTVKQLPKKVIEACDAYLDEILNDKNNKQ